MYLNANLFNKNHVNNQLSVNKSSRSLLTTYKNKINHIQTIRSNKKPIACTMLWAKQDCLYG